MSNFKQQGFVMQKGFLEGVGPDARELSARGHLDTRFGGDEGRRPHCTWATTLAGGLGRTVVPSSGQKHMATVVLARMILDGLASGKKGSKGSSTVLGVRSLQSACDVAISIRIYHA